MAKKDNENEDTPETPPVAKPAAPAKNPFLCRLVIKQKGKAVEVPEKDNYTVSAIAGTEITRGERPAILKELTARFPKCAFTWIG